jgi:uncharacterized protein (DUF58 family)
MTRARSNGLSPTRPLVAACLALLLLGFVVAVFRDAAMFWLVALGVLAGVAVWDGLAVRFSRPPRVERDLEAVMPVGVWSTVRIEVENFFRHSMRLLLHDYQPADFEVSSMPVSMLVPGRSRMQASYRARGRTRGDHHFHGMDLLIRSPFGLWDRKLFLPVSHHVRVFPNFREVSRYTLLATDNRVSRMGVYRRRHRGEGSDFLQLREYRLGDSLRQIDWKATSRYRRLISKEYRDERDQQVIFMLDCGHRMRHRDDGREHLDQALNALLLLAHVVIEQGDSVGLLTFGGDQRWYPPSKTQSRLQDLIEAVYDLGTTPEAADYAAAAEVIMPAQRRRALIVLITNTRDEDQDELLLALKLLKRRHLVIVADMREQILDETLQQPVTDLDGAFRFQAVNDYLERRRKNQRVLRHHGHYALDILPGQLPVALVNQYLSIKAAGRL